LERHLHLTEHQFVAVTLWIAHSFLYSRFSVTPRLALVSPVRGCGKITALSIINALAFKARKTDHTTPAVLFRIIDRENPCVLLDEVDNFGLLSNPTLRAVVASGHHRRAGRAILDICANGARGHRQAATSVATADFASLH
jgi:hypothetical protein